MLKKKKNISLGMEESFAEDRILISINEKKE